FADQILPLMGLVKISDEEMAILYPQEDMTELSGRFPLANWVLTCSEGRVEVWKNGLQLCVQQFEPVANVIDSSAAGDAFIATYIAATLTGSDLPSALQQAHAVAAQVVSYKGSIVPLNLENILV
ncbi:MAG: PfkB family carbohydrate kinase, partial [Sneathiella sp.]